MQLPAITAATPLDEVLAGLRHPALSVRGQAVYEAVARWPSPDKPALCCALTAFVSDRRNWQGRIFGHLPLAAIALAEWLRMDATAAAIAFAKLPTDLRAAAPEYLADLGVTSLLPNAPALAA